MRYRDRHAAAESRCRGGRLCRRGGADQRADPRGHVRVRYEDEGCCEGESCREKEGGCEGGARDDLGTEERLAGRTELRRHDAVLEGGTHPAVVVVGRRRVLEG